MARYYRRWRRRLYRRRYPYRRFRRRITTRYNKGVSQNSYFLKYDVSCEIEPRVIANAIKHYVIVVDQNVWGRTLNFFDFLTAHDLGLFNQLCSAFQKFKLKGVQVNVTPMMNVIRPEIAAVAKWCIYLGVCWPRQTITNVEQGDGHFDYVQAHELIGSGKTMSITFGQNHYSKYFSFIKYPYVPCNANQPPNNDGIIAVNISPGESLGNNIDSVNLPAYKVDLRFYVYFYLAKT